MYGRLAASVFSSSTTFNTYAVGGLVMDINK
jgi:hypothetical protein